MFQGLPGVWPIWKLLAGTKVDQIVLRGRGQPVFPPEDNKDEDKEYDKGQGEEEKYKDEDKQDKEHVEEDEKEYGRV